MTIENFFMRGVFTIEVSAEDFKKTGAPTLDEMAVLHVDLSKPKDNLAVEFLNPKTSEVTRRGAGNAGYAGGEMQFTFLTEHPLSGNPIVYVIKKSDGRKGLEGYYKGYHRNEDEDSSVRKTKARQIHATLY